MYSLYARLIVRHAYLIIFVVCLISTILTVIPLACHDLPSFSDPVAGFETRGTELASRFIAWENLIDETRPSRRLAVNPQEIVDQIRMNDTYNRVRADKTRSGQRNSLKSKINKQKNNKTKSTTATFPTLSILEGDSSEKHDHYAFGKAVTYEDENTAMIRNFTRKQWASIKEMEWLPGKPVHSNHASGSCGTPIADYAHLVVTSNDNSSLLTFENIMKLCHFQSRLVEIGGSAYYNLCQRSTKSEDVCCPVWSVPNYIALMSGKRSCENLTRDDVNMSITILKKCAEYFHNFSLLASCELGRCRVPIYCSQYDAVYNLLFYLIDSDAFTPTEHSQSFVRNVMIFLPLPASSTVLPYYNKIQSSNLSYDTLVIAAIDFGLKNTLFDIWIIEDTWLIGLGGLFVFLSVWIYTRSTLMTILLFVAISYSLGIAYFLYIHVYNLHFFPFMNLLVIVIVIGIGADDAFLYVKIWKMISKQLIKDNLVSQGNHVNHVKSVSIAGETILIHILEETLKHSFVAILVTALTTAVAFFASYVSYIPAINCFSVFAGTAVLVNFVLMITLLPASMFIIDVKLCTNQRNVLDVVFKSINEIWKDISVILNRFIIMCVMRLHIGFVLILGVLGVSSIVVVFYYPGLQLPDSRQFQLFRTSHPFEQYDIYYREKFIFERFSRDINTGGNMPMRWIWGIDAIDNGNHMDPSSTGRLIFNNQFSISDPNSQMWLLEFCKKIKAQPFYQSTLGPLLPNCFIESFKMYMERKCIDTIDKIDRTPCCETSKFPYRRKVFNLCIVKAITSLYQTPREYFMPGVAGPKFLRNSAPPVIAAVVVEFESVVPYSMSYAAMDDFYNRVETWTRQQLVTAPPGLKRGWFLSDFHFYDLQKTLAGGTITALILSAVLGFIVLIPATLSLFVSIYALTAMIFSATVTIAILVLCGWKLNILESVAISTSAGLAVDFSLHYALSYTYSSGTKCTRVKYALSTSAGPTAAAALTTGFAGIFLLRSNLLPYAQIGTFLALIMSVSWIYATFFLCSLLYLLGGTQIKDLPVKETKTLSRVSSICSELPNLESHELEQLADSSRTNITHSYSPSSVVSATTVVLHDEHEQCHTNIERKLSIEVVSEKNKL